MDDQRPFLRSFVRLSPRWYSLATVLACAACAPRVSVTPPPPPAPPYDATVHARVLALADARRSDAVALDSAITAAHPIIRASAALTIGQLKARGLAPQLTAATRDPDSTVARYATFALGLLRDSSHLPTLRVLADSAREPVAVEALWSLGELGVQALPLLDRFLTDTTARPVRWRRELLLAAAKLRPVPVAQVIPYLAQPDTEIVWAAAYALSRQRSPAAVRPLAERVGAPSAQVRALIARALAKQATGDSLAAMARTALGILARDAHPHVRINAARSLGTHGAADLLLRLASDPDANVRIAAAQSAVAPATGQLPRLYFERFFAADTSWMFRRSVIESAFRAGIRLNAASEWYASRDWRRRVTVAETMTGARTPTTLDDLEQLTRDSDGRVRAAALGALAPLADSGDVAPRVRTMLLVALRDADLFARAAAIRSLSGTARASEAPLVLSSYRLAAVDRDNDARLAALRFVLAAWTRDSTAFTPGLRESIRGLSAPADRLERRVVEGSALFAHWARADPTPHPAAWYEALAIRYSSPDSQPVAELVTERGTIVVQLHGRDAPLTVDNFVTLVRQGFYDGLRFHRVVPNFVAQDGDPRGDGNGGPGYAIRDEITPLRFDRGVVGMALSGPDTGGSQYFITHSPQPHLDGHYPVFGQVLEGFDVLDAIVQGDAIRRIRIR